jgi:prepilin-type N-terminal cleavage/methylation domain-containing protein
MRTAHNADFSGFSLVELMIVLVLVLAISAAIFQTINMTTQRTATEQTKVDMFQEAREFMDQMSRDLRQAGFPSTRNMDPALVTNGISDTHIAAGLVYVNDGELWFEGDVDGSGTPSLVQYHLAQTGTNCPCLQRSQQTKNVTSNPYNGTLALSPVYQVEVQGVQNTNGKIFTAWTNGTSITLPININANPGSIASVDTIQAALSLQSPTVDPQTRQHPVTTLVSTVRLNNCSMAAIGYKLSC